MRGKLMLVFGLGVLLASSGAYASVLYASRAAGSTGELYTLNPATGAMVQDIGPTNDVTGLNYPITGLAFHPVTGVLYGSTGNAAGAASYARLVTIDPTTAAVSVVGLFDAGPVSSGGNPSTMADLAFDASGNLYGVGSVGGPNLYSINTATGKATLVGANGVSTSTTGGGLGIGAGGFFGTPTASRFGTYDSGTGAYTNIANPTRPLGGGYGALAFDGSVLYGLNVGSAVNNVVPTELVTINPATGAVTNVGLSVDALDAIAFVPEPGTAGILAIALGLLLGRRRGNH